MLKFKNTSFQDLSQYIPSNFSESETSCLQVKFNKQTSEAMVSTLDNLATEVFAQIAPTLNKTSFLPLPEDIYVENPDAEPIEKPALQNRIAWINKYGPGQSTGFHNHSDPIFTSNATHYGIYVLAVGSKKETLSFIANDIQEDIEVAPGDLFVGSASDIHGALPVKEYLCALMFKINAG
jgi:hypothetical protein